jgi:hypothetical protein
MWNAKPKTIKQAVMTVTVKNNTAERVVPASVRRQGVCTASAESIKAGDRLEFKASRGAITITVSQPPYRPAKAELSAIRKGESAIASGEYVTLTERSVVVAIGANRYHYQKLRHGIRRNFQAPPAHALGSLGAP